MITEFITESSLYGIVLFLKVLVIENPIAAEEKAFKEWESPE